MNGNKCPYCGYRTPNGLSSWVASSDPFRACEVSCQKCHEKFLVMRPLKSVIPGAFIIFLVIFLFGFQNLLGIREDTHQAIVTTSFFPVIGLFDYVLIFKKLKIDGHKIED